jgi:hypothetical protein
LDRSESLFGLLCQGLELIDSGRLRGIVGQEPPQLAQAFREIRGARLVGFEHLVVTGQQEPASARLHAQHRGQNLIEPEEDFVSLLDPRVGTVKSSGIPRGGAGDHQQDEYRDAKSKGDFAFERLHAPKGREGAG